MAKRKVKLTQKGAENSPAGGVVVGERNGQTMIYDDASVGGYFVGKTHSKGGIKMINKSNGQQLEVQGSEVIITAPAVSDQTKNEFNGKMMTNREILSQINVNGGGVAFAKGGDIPKRIKRTGASYKYGGKTMTDHEIYKYITGGGIAEEFSIRDIADIHQIPLAELKQEVRIGMLVESEHKGDKKEQMEIVKDHLFENPKYYTLLKQANSQTKDLNNLNDVLDIDADGVYGAETGLFAGGGLIAPNGNKSNLTPEQYKLVRTPEFKAWFGDWENDPENASKVVDENVEPMVVYHTTSNEFNVFSKKKSKEGFFFAPQKERLSVYNKLNINSYFLNLRNPSHEMFKSDLNYLIPKGYDGIMDYGHAKHLGNKNLYEIVAFEPNQIKLADGTNTTFDANNPDIRYDAGGSVGVETILFAVKKGEPDYNEVLITNNPDRIEDAKKWALANGFDRLRVSKIDMNSKPDFKKTFATGGAVGSDFTFLKSNPMQRARAIIVLEKKIRHDGKIIPNYEFLEELPKNLEVGVSKLYSNKSEKGYVEKTVIGDFIVDSKAEVDYYNYLKNGGYPYSKYIAEVREAEAKKREADKIVSDEQQRLREISDIERYKNSKIAKNNQIKELIENGADAMIKKMNAPRLMQIEKYKTQRQTNDVKQDIEYHTRMIEQTERQVNNAYKIASELYKIVNGEVQPKFDWKIGDKVKVEGYVNNLPAEIETEIVELKENKFGEIAYRVESKDGIANSWISYDGIYPSSENVIKNYDWDVTFTNGFNKGQKLSEQEIETIDVYDDFVYGLNFKSGGSFDAKTEETIGLLSITYNPVNLAVILENDVDGSNYKAITYNQKIKRRLYNLAEKSNRKIVLNNNSSSRINREFPFLLVSENDAENYVVAKEFYEKLETPRNEFKKQFTKKLEEEKKYNESISDKNEYEYVLTQRPFDIGTYPLNNFIRFEEKDFQYGVVIYSEPLSIDEMERYSLSPITEIKDYDGKILDYKIGNLKLKARVKLETDKRKGYYVNLFISDNNGIKKTQPMSGVNFLMEIKNGRLILENESTVEPMNEKVNKKEKSFESEGSTEGKGKLYEFFTPQIVADKMLALAQHYGFKGGNVLEPATGSGRLIKNLKNTNITAFEISKDNFEILKREFPNAELYNFNFEKAFLKEPRFNTLINRKGTETWLKNAPFDLVMANPPYGKFSGLYSSYFNFKGQVEHFFILQTLYLLKKGGLGVYLIPSSFLRNGVAYNEIKKQIFEIAEFVDAYRLPSNIFEKTQIGTDILILRKK